MGQNFLRKFQKDLNGLYECVIFVRCFEVCRTSKLPEKGFNCCGAEMSLRCAESRFAEPRCSLQRERVVTFCVVQKVTKKHTGRSPATSIQSSVGSEFAKFSGGTCRNRFCLQNAGVKALNRCERVTVVQTQDRCFSKMDYCTASSQWFFADKIRSCSLVWVWWEIETFVC